MKGLSKVLSIFVFITIIIVANLSFATGEDLELIKPIDVQNTVNNDFNLDEVDDKYSPELEDEIFRTIFGDDYQNLTMDSITGSEPKKAEIETIDGEESIKGDKYIHQEKIDFSGLGDGNYLLIGSEVNISSQKLTGNVLILADKITISGNVTGSVVAAGETITLSGSVQDLYTTGKNVVIENGAYIERALKCWNENLNIKGGQVGYEVYSVSSHTTIAKEAYLPEKIAYSGELEAPDNIKEIATVIEGAMEMQEASQMIETAANTMIKVLKTVYVLMSGLVNLIIIIILANLMKKFI